MVHRFLSSLRIIQPLVLLPTSDPSIREFEKKNVATNGRITEHNHLRPKYGIL